MDPLGDIVPGSRIGPYRIIARLGRGGMGQVFLADDPRLRRQVALKCLLSPDEAQDQRASILSEARAAARITHPNVATVHDVIEQDERAFIVMAFVEGESLAVRLKRDRLPLETALTIAQQLASALAAAHTQGIVHRDLKPANIQLRPDGSVSVLDFGVAKALSAPLPASEITSTGPTNFELGGRLAGTPAYMSPEQLMGRQVDGRSDVYSLGVVLSEMVAERGSRSARESTVTMTSATETPPIPLELSEIITTATALDPKDRFQTADRFESALRSIRARLSPPAPAVWRPRVAAIVGLAVVAVTIVMALLLSKGGLQLTTPEAGGARRAIAIVGFKNSSGRTDVAWLSTAFAEAIGSELAAAKGVRVIPAETVARMKAELRLSEADGFSRDTLTRVRAGVGADLVLTGAYIATGSGDESQVRLDLRVQEVQSGYTVARASQNGTTGRLFDLLNQTTRAILDELGLEGPTETDGTALRASIPETPDATRLYAEGLEKLRVGDALGARDVLLRATVAEPSFALAHAALARAWILLGFDSSAADAAKRAMDLSGSLGETDRLWIEGLYRGTTKQWDRAIATYRTLFDRFPDSVDYGLRLAETQTIAGKAKDALETVAALRKLPGPGRDDPQIDLAEAAAAQALSDFARELTAASEAARKATDAGASILVARARMAEGWAFRNLGDLDKAKAANQDAKRLYSAAGDRRGVARAMIQVGSVLRAQGNLRGAEMELVQALQIVREIGNSRNTAQTLVNLANVLFDTGRAAEAQPLYTEAAALYRTIGDQTGLASALSNLAEVLNRQGEFAAGLKVATEALAIRRKVGSKSGIALSLLNMAEVLSDQGELGRSRAMYQESLALNRETGSQEEISYSLHGLGRVLLRQDKLSDAKAKQDEARRIRETLGAKVAIAESRAAIAELLCEDQRFGEASDLALSAADVARDEKDIDLEARSRGIAASAFLSADRIPEARQSLDRVATLARTSWSRRTRMELDIVTARLQAASGQVDAALNLLKAVKADATKIGFVAYVLEAQLARAVILSRTSQLELARSELNQVERDATARGFQLISRKAARTNRVSAK